MQNEPACFLITGSRGAGKTTTCARLAAAARSAGWQVGGILSHPIYAGERRIQIEAEDLRTQTRKVIAQRREDDSLPSAGYVTRRWQFDAQAMQWADEVFAQAAPVDLLVVDELGGLELEQGRGWQSALTAIESQTYAVVLIVVRPELLAHALTRWQTAHIIEIDTPEDADRKSAALCAHLFG